AGAAGAMGVTTILLALGPGLGLAASSPWSFNNPAPAVFTTAAAVWLIVTQWLSASFGGYLSGRLRKKWVGIRTDEVLFRDTTHGFLSWAVATVFMVALFSIVASTAAVTGDVATVAPTAEAQQAAASYSLFTALSFLIGAFIASAAAAWGGYDRDEM